MIQSKYIPGDWVKIQRTFMQSGGGFCKQAHKGV